MPTFFFASSTDVFGMKCIGACIDVSTCLSGCTDLTAYTSTQGCARARCKAECGL